MEGGPLASALPLLNGGSSLVVVDSCTCLTFSLIFSELNFVCFTTLFSEGFPRRLDSVEFEVVRVWSTKLFLEVFESSIAISASIKEISSH